MKLKQESWIASAARDDLASILKHLPCGVAVLKSPLGKALYVNEQLVKILGYDLDDVPSTKAFYERAMPDCKERRQARKAWLAEVKAGGNLDHPQPEAYVCADGVVRTFETWSAILRKDLIVCLWTDVTQREAAQKQVRESESRFRSFFENSSDPFLLFDEGRVVNCNLAALRLFGYDDKDGIIGKTIEEMSHNMQAKNRSSQTSHTKSLFKVDGRRREWNIRRVDETAVPVEISAATIVLEGKSYLFAVLRDIREWKEAQLQLRRSKDELDKRVRERTADLATVNRQLKREIEAHKKTAVRMRTSREELRYLSEYLQKIREDERTGAAREVHDQLGQILSAVAIDLACLRKKLVSDQENWVSEQIQQIEGRIGETMRSVRDICAKLRPPNFEDFGLSTAIRWHLREYQDRTGILCSATIDDELSDIEKELGMVIFRIYQEAMTNIFRHADATRVTVILKRDQDRLLLKISDDGKGITAEQITSPRSYGVLGIRERVRFWGGKSRLEGVAGKGTTVEVILPLHPAQRLKRRASTENDIDW